MTKHSPIETWTVDAECIKGDQADMYPILFERVHATEADMRLAAAAPALLDMLRRVERASVRRGSELYRDLSALLASLDSLS
jgi:hypothetical protein